jgi:hypothetical protein
MHLGPTVSPCVAAGRLVVTRTRQVSLLPSQSNTQKQLPGAVATAMNYLLCCSAFDVEMHAVCLTSSAVVTLAAVVGGWQKQQSMHAFLISSFNCSCRRSARPATS